MIMMKIKYLVWLFFMILCIAANSSCKSDNQLNKQLKYENGVEISSELSTREIIDYHQKLGLAESEDGHDDDELSSVGKAKQVYGGTGDMIKKKKNGQSAPTSSSPKQLLLGFLLCLIIFFPF
ncbi:hypothetical protein F8388_016164 [Cannabis sativa]|uniref:Uncharacterized protein n=1 Tax=Cannabis sativa TaxID=3483 RepID=A0A7J6FIH7_CANSA|nr:hypothetical protein F8388_016164 [Cannabis sativa]